MRREKKEIGMAIIGTDENVNYAANMAADGHRTLVLTMTMDVLANFGRPVEFPVDVAELGN